MHWWLNGADPSNRMQAPLIPTTTTASVCFPFQAHPYPTLPPYLHTLPLPSRTSLQLLQSAGAVLLQREIPETVNEEVRVCGGATHGSGMQKGGDMESESCSRPIQLVIRLVPQSIEYPSPLFSMSLSHDAVHVPPNMHAPSATKIFLMSKFKEYP